MKQNKLFILILLILVLFSSFLFADKVVQTSTGETSWDIIIPKNEYIPINEDFYFYVHVYNSSGVLLTNVSASCYIHLYSSSGLHIVEEEMSFNDNYIDFEYIINSSYLNFIGELPYIVYCNDTSLGGFTSGTYLVNDHSSINISENNLWMPIITILGLIGIILVIFAIYYHYSGSYLHYMFTLLTLFNIFFMLSIGTKIILDANFKFEAMFGYYSLGIGMIILFLFVYILLIFTSRMIKVKKNVSYNENYNDKL